MMDTIVTIILSCLASTGLFSLIQFLITRKDKKRDRISALEKKLSAVELDTKRTQLLLLITNYPGETTEIMRVARYYFEDLDGDWYMDTLFTAWLRSRELPRPYWLKEEG